MSLPAEQLYTLRWWLSAPRELPDDIRASLTELVTAELERVQASADAAPDLSPPPAALPPLREVEWMVPDGQPFPVVGQGFSVEEFGQYLATIDDMHWTPHALCVHHTASPSLGQRPAGFTGQHMANLRHYYKDELQWSAGPHLFIDQDQIWVFSPLEYRGIHAVSFNREAIGIEMLGDYDREDPTTGRGAQVLATTRKALRLLAQRFFITLPERLLFHRDDPRTSKTCPGRKVTKDMLWPT